MARQTGEGPEERGSGLVFGGHISKSHLRGAGLAKACHASARAYFQRQMSDLGSMCLVRELTGIRSCQQTCRRQSPSINFELFHPFGGKASETAYRSFAWGSDSRQWQAHDVNEFLMKAHRV